MADTNAINEDEDEDYMGDLSKFLPTQPSSHCQPKRHPSKTLTNSSQQPSKKKPKFHNWQQQRQLQKERIQQQEDEKTLENIQLSAIPQSNIGFKLLKQMGYTPGKGLGKEGSTGRDEPIDLEIRRSRAGIGREDPAKERARKEKEKMEWKMRSEKVMMEDFEVRKKSEWRSKRVVVNYHKAKAVVDQLENREPEVEVDKDENSGDDEEEEEEEVITEEDLVELLVKLREDHRYCLFCGCQYESTEALLSNCPGLDEEDH